MTIIAVTDLPTAMQSAELVDVMVAGANARAARVAPCLVATDTPPSDDLLAEAKLVLLGAIKRWVEAGSGSLQSQQAGPYGITVDTRQRTGYNLWPSEIAQLQDLCKAQETSGAYAIDTVAAVGNAGHADTCALNFGAAYCSCGYVLTQSLPLYGA